MSQQDPLKATMTLDAQNLVDSDKIEPEYINTMFMFHHDDPPLSATDPSKQMSQAPAAAVAGGSY